MNKEQQQIIDEVYEKYLTDLKSRKHHEWILSKEEFVNRCKTDPEFSEKWGLKIEERELSEKERIIFAGYDYENGGGIGWNMIRETVDMDNSIPRKLITLTYNNEKIESYEHMKNFEETEAYKSIDEMLKAYRNGDDNLDGFPDSIEKQTLLSTIENWKSKMSENKLSNDELLDLKSKIDSAKNEEEVVKIILNIMDNYEITPEIREVFSKHKDLIRRIRKINKN